jgi:hypothetical protein
LASWTKQVALTGTTNSLLLNVGNNVASGSDAFIFTPANTGLNFFDSKVLISATGNIFNDTTTLFNDSSDNTVFGVYPDSNSVLCTNMDAEELKVTTSIILPSGSLSGGLLYVQDNGLLSSNRLSTYDSIVVNDSNKNPNGSSKFRYFSSGNIFAIANSTNTDNGFDEDNYDIIISTNNNQNTTFNSRQALTNHFSIFSTTDVGPRGLHYSNSGVLSVNALGPQQYSADNDIRLRVIGKIHADSIRVGADAATQSGYYLRAIDTSGTLALQPLSLPLNQTATFPISANYTPGNGNYVIELSNYKTNTLASQLEGGNKVDGGKVLVYNGGLASNERWAVSNNFNARQGACGSSCYNGLEFGNRTSMLQTNGMMTYAAGSFKSLQGAAEYDTYDGASQTAWYHLRSATSGIQNNELITDFPVSVAVNTKNIMSFSDTVLDAGYQVSSVNRNYIWQYTISLNAIWQSGTNVSTIDGGCFIIEGAIKKIGSSITNIGSQTVRTYLPSTRPILTGVVQPYSSDGINRLQILASGGTANYHIKWSATAQINQINLPSGAFAFQY